MFIIFVEFEFSDIFLSTFKAENAVDGNSNTRFITDSEESAYFSVYLREPTFIYQIRILGIVEQYGAQYLYRTGYLKVYSE